MNIKVLIADDDFDNRTIVQEALAASDYVVLSAADGQEAWQRIQTDKPDIILLDLSMPKLNGWDLARRVRQDPALSHLKLIAFTAHALAGAEVKAKAAGCDDYIAKPCLPKDVVARVNSWVEQTRELGAKTPAV
ncbi:MAG TPA: response regulator [Elusimicrobiota bacterium]|nr:response regulator [Elusimicrobiota bacterium]